MARGKCRYREYMVAVCLLVSAGCVPARQPAKGVSGQESPAVKAGAEAPEARQRKSEAMPSSPGAPEPKGYCLLGDDPTVAERITLFEQKKSDWEATGNRLKALGAEGAWPAAGQECQRDIELALAGYRRLRTGEDRALNPWEIVGRDMHYFTRNCDQVLAAAQAQGAGPKTLAVATTVQGGGNDQLRQYFEAGQYQEAVAAYEGAAKGQDGAQIPRQDKVIYGRALVKLGRFQEAAGVMTELLRGESGQPPDLATFEIRMLTADVLLAVGQVDEARQVYDGLAKALASVVNQQTWAEAHAKALAEQVKPEDLELYREVIQAYLQFDGQRVPQALVDGVAKLQGQTANPLQDLARMLQARVTEQSQAWARGQLAEVRALINNHDLAKAKTLLEQLSAAAPAEMRGSITQIQAEIAQAEQAGLKTPGQEATGVPSQVSPWEEAMHLFEQQKYDEAIAGFQNLLEDSVHGAEAKAKMAEAAELAAAAMRRQAAALYAKARKTFDPTAKRQALLDSRALLTTLITRYPEASIVDKARQNLKVLDAELGQAETTPPQISPPAEGSQPDQF